jgi:hypothetical protein
MIKTKIFFYKNNMKQDFEPFPGFQAQKPEPENPDLIALWEQGNATVATWLLLKLQT